jgi:DNA-binding phage protein
MTRKRAVKVIERIRELGLTNKEVALAAGVDERSVYRWLSYEREPRLRFDQVACVCSLLKWSVQELAEAYYPVVDGAPVADESPGGSPPK